jgi:hypothetical protein
VLVDYNSYKPITNTAWVRAGFVNYKKGCTRLAAGSDKVYQLLAHCQWFSPGTPASSTTKTGRHDIHNKLTQITINNYKTNVKISYQSGAKISININGCYKYARYSLLLCSTVILSLW